MITHTFLNKCNTIIENKEFNTGLNPIAELNAGETLTRILLSFDLDVLKQNILINGINIKSLKHILKMTNCGTVNLPLFKDKIFNNCSEKTRASSFDIIAFKIPKDWDSGRGFDYQEDYIKESHRVISKDGSNWFQCKNNDEWDEYGVYNIETLKNNPSLIISKQHFDTGTENLELDITDYVNDILSEKYEDYGIGLCFDPYFEENAKDDKFISFFTQHTNTFFTPYLETTYDNDIIDNRANFHIGVNNKLYFYVSDNGNSLNLDELPTCFINDVEYEVKQSQKGVYYIDILIKKGKVEPYTILYDKWSNIVLNGQKIDDIEMEFVVLPMEEKISFGKHKTVKVNYEPQLSGIKEKENITIGDIREIAVDFIEEYSYGKKYIPSFAEFRLYVKEGDREIDVFPFQPIERRYDEHMFIINTNQLIPNVYHIDIRVSEGRELKYFNNILEFKIVSNVTNFYK